MPQFEGKITEVRRYGQGTLLSLSTDLSRVEPGQFAHVLCGTDSGRILRRPFSIMDFTKDTLSLLVKAVGQGTDWLVGRQAGEILDVLAPLGRGFDRDICSRPLLVAGGTGLAPLNFLARSLRAERDYSPKLLWGLNCGEDFGTLPGSLGHEIDLVIATCDGSAGMAGTAVDLLRRELARGDNDGVFACGPEPMLAAMRPLLEQHGLPCQVSVEQRMACGIGACYGCAVRKRGPEESYLRACLDGPVFDYADLDWRETASPGEAGE